MATVKRGYSLVYIKRWNDIRLVACYSYLPSLDGRGTGDYFRQQRLQVPAQKISAPSHPWVVTIPMLKVTDSLYL